MSQEILKHLKAGFLDYEKPRFSFGESSRFKFLQNCITQNKYLLLVSFFVPSMLMMLFFLTIERTIPLQWAISHYYSQIMHNLQAAMWGIVLAKTILFINSIFKGMDRAENKMSWNRMGSLLTIFSTAYLFMSGYSMGIVLLGGILVPVLFGLSSNIFKSRIQLDPLTFILSMLMAGWVGSIFPEAIIMMLFHSPLIQEAYMTPPNFAQGLMWSQFTPMGIWSAPIYWGFQMATWLGALGGALFSFIVFMSYTKTLKAKYKFLNENSQNLQNAMLGLKISIGVLIIFSLFELTLNLNWNLLPYFVSLLTFALTFKSWSSLKMMSLGLLMGLIQILTESFAIGDFTNVGI